MAKRNCIMLINANEDDNFLHEQVIKNSGLTETILVTKLATEALEYLKSKKEHPNAHPDLVFIDSNMPGMNSWKFLDEYSKLGKKFQCTAVIIMLTTSVNPDDKAKALSYNVSVGFKTKPLTEEMLEEIMLKYFSIIKITV